MIAAQREARSAQPSGIARFLEWIVFDVPFLYGRSPRRLVITLLIVVLLGAWLLNPAHKGGGLGIPYRLAYSFALLLPFELPIEKEVAPELNVDDRKNRVAFAWRHAQIVAGWVLLGLIGLSLSGYFDTIRG